MEYLLSAFFFGVYFYWYDHRWKTDSAGVAE